MSNRKLNTKDIKGGGEGSTPKTLKPGNHTCTINSVRLEDFKFKPGAVNIILNLEGPDLGEGFDGFFLDKTNESKGKHKGQVADVKAGQWAFADGTTKTGIKISRDEDVLKFMKNLCLALGINDWFVAQDDKHDTIASLVSTFNKEKPFAGKAINYCIAGSEYINKNGYTAYDLFLPKYSKAGAAYGSKVVTFNETEHIKKKDVKAVSEFSAGDNSEVSSTAASDFEL